MPARYRRHTDCLCFTLFYDDGLHMIYHLRYLSSLFAFFSSSVFIFAIFAATVCVWRVSRR